MNQDKTDMTQAERTKEVERACRYVRDKLKLSEDFTEENKKKWAKDASKRFKVSPEFIFTLIRKA
jgi:hypothetical protein